MRNCSGKNLTGGRFRPEQVAGLNRNGWQLSPEWVAGFNRNTHLALPTKILYFSTHCNGGTKRGHILTNLIELQFTTKRRNETIEMMLVNLRLNGNMQMKSLESESKLIDWLNY